MFGQTCVTQAPIECPGPPPPPTHTHTKEEEEGGGGGGSVASLIQVNSSLICAFQMNI